MIAYTTLAYQYLCMDLMGRAMVGPVGVRAWYLGRMARTFGVDIGAMLKTDDTGLISGDRLQSVKLCSQHRELYQKVM
jgi:hypothetical protein